MQLEWSALAIEDRNAIFEYIEADSPQAAILVDERIENHVEQLIDFPLTGRPGRIAETRELVIQRTPYIAVYRTINNTVLILRVLHGARMWPGEIPAPLEPQ